MDYKVDVNVRLIVVADDEGQARSIAMAEVSNNLHLTHSNLRWVVVGDVEEINSHGK